MFGLVVLAFAAVYFTVMFFAVRGAWRMGLADGGTWRRAIGFASVAFLAVYLPVFWDLIPTHAVHRYMCAQDAGFTAYVDAKEWRVATADGVESAKRLNRNDREASVSAPNTVEGFERTILYGGLLARDQEFKRVTPWLTVVRKQQRITDAREGVLLGAAIDYEAGSRTPDDMRWWLRTGSCVIPSASSEDQQSMLTEPFEQFWKYVHTLKGEQS